MKKYIPYLLSLIIGTAFGLIIFSKANFTIDDILKDKITVTAFQLGVFNDIETAKEFKNKYSPAVIIEDDDAYRVYYSMLTDTKSITKMENYLNSQKIAFYKKEITIEDENLIKALNDYESGISKGNDTVLVSLNKIIMSSYKEKEIWKLKSYLTLKNQEKD